MVDKDLEVKRAFIRLIENGFDIRPQGDNEYLVIDNGKFGFAEYHEPFTVDSHELLNIYDTYIVDNTTMKNKPKSEYLGVSGKANVEPSIRDRYNEYLDKYGKDAMLIAWEQSASNVDLRAVLFQAEEINEPIKSKSNSMFTSCMNKGLQMTFENNFTISIQFGVGNYCERQQLGKPMSEMKQDIVESSDAEIAIWHNTPDGEEDWFRFDGEGYNKVHGWCTTDEVAKWIQAVSSATTISSLYFKAMALGLVEKPVRPSNVVNA